MQKTKELLFFLVVVFFTTYQSLAQSYYFRNYSVEDGLPFVEVSTIHQDSKGNLWSGGYGGLSKFDGISFTNYTPANGLLNHSVTSITEDNAGNLWIGTIDGINKYDGAVFTAFTTQNGLVNNSITASLKDHKGNLWFGTAAGLSKLANNTFTNYTTKNGLIDNSITTLFEDNNHFIWIGTTKGLSLFDGTSFTNFTTHDKLPSNSINTIIEDSENTYWLGTTTGLCKFTITLPSKKLLRIETLMKDKIKTLFLDFKNTIWIGTTKGLIKYQNKRFVNYPIRIDQNSNLINCFFQDYENNLWIGTYAGLFMYRGNPFVSYGLNEGLFNNFIYGITRDSKQNLWVGSQNGLFLNNAKTHSYFIKLNDFDSISVSAIFEQSPNTLWIATNKGIKIIENNQLKVEHDTSSVFHNTINCIYRDSKNNIWLGGNNEFYKYDGKKFMRYAKNTLPTTSNYQVWTFVEDHQGTLWIGTYLGGLFNYKDGVFAQCSNQLHLTSDSYLSSLIDSNGNLYFATLDGVCMFNPSNSPSTTSVFTNKDGMSSALVYSLTFGKTQSEIWAGTNQGLNKIDIDDYKKTGKKSIIQFGKQEGFSGVECNSNGTFVEHDGSIWFGTVNGLIKYNPSEYIENTAESKISFSGFKLFYKDTLLKDNVALAYNDNNITINYSGICLTNPTKVKYTHILMGIEKNWSPASKDRFTRYSNLPPGSYTFKVISTNNEDVWNKQAATFTFIIQKPYYKTWWFILSCFVMLVSTVALILRLRINKIKQTELQKTELNKKIANIESQALRAQMNPHFIFNTLSSIQHYISSSDIDAALKYLSKFAKLMRKIMDNSKQPMISVAEEVDALNLYLELEVMRFEKKFTYTILVDKAIDTNYDRIPSMLIQPYVENSILHGLLPKEGEGNISIQLKKQENTILCIIDDNGIGRKQSQEFKKNRVEQHKSMGMSITQERLALLNSSLNSTISVEIIDMYNDGNPAGTKVQLIIPLEVSE